MEVPAISFHSMVLLVDSGRMSCHDYFLYSAVFLSELSSMSTVCACYDHVLCWVLGSGLCRVSMKLVSTFGYNSGMFHVGFQTQSNSGMFCVGFQTQS